MKKIFLITFALLFCFSAQVFAQISVKILVNISKAEDELRFDSVLETLINDKNPKIRARAALAAGRIGSEAAITSLSNLLEKDTDANVRAMAAFAIGEIESLKGAEPILKILAAQNIPDIIRARALEAAGKIAAANSKDESAKTLGKAILAGLDLEEKRGAKQNDLVILLGITAALRAKPDESDKIIVKFLKSPNARIRTDAGNTMARLRAKNANDIFRSMLVSDKDPNSRANAARALGAAEDQEAADLLINAALTDIDLRVRVSAIRSLGSLKEADSANKLTERGEALLSDYKKSKFATPTEKNELLEIASVLGRLLENTKHEKAVAFLNLLQIADSYSSAETEIALAKILKGDYVEPFPADADDKSASGWRTSSAAFQALGVIASAEGENEEKYISQIRLIELITLWIDSESKEGFGKGAEKAIPDLLRAYAATKSETISDIYRPLLEFEEDVFIRAAIAEILGDLPASKENIVALKTAFAKSLETDKDYNDAQLSILSALVKLDKKESFESLRLAVTAPDYLVRKQAANLIKQHDLTKDFSNIEKMVGGVKPYDAKSGTKLGQVLNSAADYKRAVSRKNGTVKAVFTTEKGKFTINFFPEDAPLTVDNFIKLAISGYFNGIAFHRVVANFVVQDGDQRGDGNGGPGWLIRCEVNTLPYERGTVGMALSGKDTGGSQWFVTHAPQPHLDGGYTVFGKVNEPDMNVVDNLARGDKILNVKIIER